MFNKLWNKEANKEGLYTQEQIDEVKEQITKIDNKIQSMKQVIEAYLTCDYKNEERIIANQEAIKQREIEKSKLLIKLQQMKEKHVNRKKT